MEAVHVELSNEGGVIVVFEQLGNQCSGEFVLVEDDERVSFVGPSDKIGVP